MFWTGLIYQLAILLTILLTISMVVISFWEPLWNLLIILIILLIAIIGLRKAGGGQLQIIGKKIPTSNLVAEIPAAEEDHGTVLIMAHHDSKEPILDYSSAKYMYVFWSYWCSNRIGGILL